MSSSWFGNGISQITGQISSFTKEVLTEGTEEIDDHATQLKITRDRLIELETVCVSQRAEIERINLLKEELQEKVESSELQIAAISSEYRNIVHQKETEIQQLQHQHHALIEAGQKPSDPHLESEEHFDSHDSYSPYVTQAARQLDSHATSSENHTTVDLQVQVQTLQAQLTSEKDSHQVELVALQDAHSQKVVQLKKRHKEEARALKDELLSLRNKQDESSASVKALQDQVLHLESVTHKQSVDLSHIHAADKQKAELLEKCQSELTECQTDRDKIQVDLTEAQMRENNLLEDLDAVTNDNRRLKDHLAQMSRVSAFSPTASTPLGKGRTSSQSAAGFDEHLDDSIISSDFSQSRQLDEQVTSLQGQVDKYEREIEHFEMVKSDWLIEKEALEEVLMKLREELRDKEEALSVAQAEQVIPASSSSAVAVQTSQGLLALKRQLPSSCDRALMVTPGEIEDDLEDLNQQVALLTDGSARLENEHDILVIEKEQLLLELQDEKDKVSSLQRQLTTVNKESDNVNLKTLEAQVAAMRAELNSKQGEIDSLRKQSSKTEEKVDLVKELDITKTQLGDVSAERDGLIESLEELDAQHQQAVQQMIESRQKLQQSNDDLKKQLETMQNESQIGGPESTVAKSEAPSDPAELKLRAEVEALRAESKELKARLTLSDVDANKLVEEKTKMAEVMKTKQSKLEEITLVLNELHMEKQEQQAKIIRLEKELRLVREELKGSKDERKSMEVDCTRLKEELSARSSEVILLKEASATTQSKGLEQSQQMEEDRKRLEEQVSGLKEELAARSSEVVLLKEASVCTQSKGLEQNQQIEKDRKRFEEQMSGLKEELAARVSEVVLLKEASASAQSKGLEQSQQIEEDRNLLEEQVSDLKQQLSSLEKEVTSLKTDKETILEQLADTRKDQEEVVSNLTQEWKEKLTTEKSAMISVRDSMERELSSTEHQMQEKSRQYEQYISELTKSRDLNATELQAEHERLMRVSHDKDVQMSKLEEQIQQLQNDLDYTKDMLQTTIDGQSHITNLLAEKDTEIDGLKKENSAVTEEAEEQGNRLNEYEAELERLNHIEKVYKQLTEDHKKVNIDNDQLKKQLRDIETEEKSKEIESKTLGVITDLEQELTQLQGSIAVKDETIQNLNSQVRDLNKVIDERTVMVEKANVNCASLSEKLATTEHKFNALKERSTKLEVEVQEKKELILNKDNMIMTLQQTVVDRDSALSKVKSQVLSSSSSESVTAQSGSLRASPDVSHSMYSSQPPNTVEVTNGDASENGRDSEIIVGEMRRQTEERDEVIQGLKQKNVTLTGLLEERSIALHGDATLVDIHRLEGEVRALRMEKEQMMQVLNDKTRECSQLKGEVHKLMNVVTAEKAALSKLQQDNQHLQHQEEDKPVVTPAASDMSKEAIKNLSRMIRDKDLEIDSLGQKNETLLQVLQESSPQEGTKITSLIQERDNLAKQVAVFQDDRQQIIAALTAKHQESVAYHGEIQRLNGLMSQENAKQDRLQQEYSVLVAQYEDRQKALVSTQQELISFKQRYVEIDNKYKEILKEKEDILSSREQSPQPLDDDNVVAMETLGDRKDPSGEESADLVDSKVSAEVPETATEQTEGKSVEIVSTEQHSTAVISRVCCDHLNELQGLRTVIEMHEQVFQEKDYALRDKDKDLYSKDRLIAERDATLDEKVKVYSELSARFHKTEQMLRTRDTEMNSLRKQNENLAFQLHGSRTDAGDLRQERDQLSSRGAALDNQMEMVKEANNKLSMALKDHAFELNALKEKNNTLTRLLQEKGSDDKEKGEMDRLMKETETLQHQARVFKVDADQFAMALQQQQEENRELKTELQKVSEREQKLSREVERLRSHLMQVEEGYTRELLEAEEREKDLRNRLAAAEDRALSASSSVDRANFQASKQVDTLGQQLHTLAEQRDVAVLQLSSVQEQSKQYAAQLSNLQMVLEQFQQEKEQQQASEIEFYLREVSSLKQEKQSLQRELRQLQLELAESNEAVAAAQRLSDQLDRKEEMISALREEVQLRERELSESEDRINSLRNSAEGKIDKALAKNLLLGYFHAPGAQKAKVIQVMAKTLDFSHTELDQLQGDSSGSWLRGMFKRSSPASTHSQPSTPTRQVPSAGSIDKSFSELFVTFLEKESSPTPQVRLPAEEMVREQQERRRPAFNPFSATVPSSSTPFAASLSSQHDPLGIGHTAGLPPAPPGALSLSSLGGGGTMSSQQSIRGQLNINTAEERNLFSAPVSGGASKGPGELHLLMAVASTASLPVFTPSPSMQADSQHQHHHQHHPRSSTLLKQAMQQS